MGCKLAPLRFLAMLSNHYKVIFAMFYEIKPRIFISVGFTIGVNGDTESQMTFSGLTSLRHSLPKGQHYFGGTFLCGIANSAEPSEHTCLIPPQCSSKTRSTKGNTRYRIDDEVTEGSTL
jgi:hypothetical protein